MRWTTLPIALAATAASLGVAAPAVAATVTVVHGVPGLRADVYVNGVKRLDGFDAGAMTSPIHLPAGRYLLAIRATGAAPSSRPLLHATLRLRAATSASIVAHLDASGHPELTIYRNDVSPIAAGRSRLVFRQAAATGPVDLIVNGTRRVRSLANPDQRTLVLPARSYSLAVAPPGGKPIWGPATVSLRAGTIYLVYAIGSPKQRTLDQLVQQVVDRAATPTRVQTGTSGLLAELGRALARPFGAAIARLLDAAPARPTAAPSWSSHRARLVDEPRTHVVAPLRVSIASIGLAARVVPAGVARDGELAVPPSGAPVAWYRYGPTPGQPGSAVLAAHVDYAGRPGAFFRLGELRRGARIDVRLADGSTRRFRVVSLHRYAKPQLPKRSIFAARGRPLLTLVTCGGRFDASTGHYSENTVVVAQPVARP